MSSLRQPGLGPVVGHTTDRSCRLWIRAGDPEDEGATLSSDRRTLGILAVTEKNGRPIANPPAYYFRLHREFDRTGTFNLGEDISLGARPGDGAAGKVYGLQPDSAYVVRLGTLTVDDPFRDDKIVDDAVLVERLPPPNVWVEELKGLGAKKSRAVFRTFPAPGAERGDLCFLLGSCRYPGLLWKVKHADRIFRPMADQAAVEDVAKRPKMALMVGDQIYADMFNRMIPIGLADTYEEFQERYLSAFGSPQMRRLLRSLPTYMILDDHEIEDNWTRDRIEERKKRVLFQIAINAYMSYQWSHGPRTYGRRLYYRFDCGGYPFFVLDGRTPRTRGDIEGDLSDNHLLGRPSPDPDYPTQLGRFLDWLVEMQAACGDAPKFVVTASVFVPNNRSTLKDEAQKDKSDSWPAFPETRRAVLETIVDKGVQNVVFLSGDIHCSNIAAMSFGGTAKAKKLRAFSITASAFYWPFPFADGDPSDYVHDSTASGQADSFEVKERVFMDYKAWNFTQEDNFCRVEVDRAAHQIKVEAFNEEGEVIVEEMADGQTRRVSGSLDLAPW